MRVGTINVPIGAGRQNWAKAFRLMAEATSVFGVNENLTAAQREVFARMARLMGFVWFALNGPNPIFWEADQYRRHDSGTVPLHARGRSSLARRYPGYNSGRQATWVVLASVADPLREFTVICTHWVPEGPKVPAPFRAWARRESKRGVKRLALIHLRRGRLVFLVGDLNVMAEFSMAIRGFRFVWVRGVGVDKVGVWVPRGVKVSDVNWSRVMAPVDHTHGIVGHVQVDW